MNKIKLLKMINIVMGLSFLVQVISAVVMILELAPEWLFKLHAFNGIVFILLAIVHIVLNWPWFKANLLKKSENTGK